jgi:NADPH-dependent 2,4-dienoyl-CoA reductase/sulfur reductase-like enzyme/peroxiredoxin family protein/TusA-related sulfurtransferase/rhodanese-related sulfurtransferase
MSTYVIVGGVAGGATAAARLRRRDEQAEIILVERGAYVSFANCGLPYHIGGAISERDALLVSTPEKLAGEFAIDVRTEQEVLSVDRQAHEVVIRRVGTDETYRQPYDKLILSPGAKPLVPPVPGVELDEVYTLRTIPDMDAIKACLHTGCTNKAVVVGGGFIGLEMAENLTERGVEVTVVEMLPQVMAALDGDMAAFLHRELRDKGVRLVLGDGLAEIRESAEGPLQVVLASGKAIDTDMVVLAIGVRPESDLARAAGLDLGPKGHIVVNEAMQTSDPDIYAVGDAIQVYNPVTGAPTAIPLAGPANRQARIAADHITGLDSRYLGTVGAAIVKVFELTAAMVGANSHTLKQAGIAFETSATHSTDHVSYYPGATQQTLKLLYSPEGKLLGAQVVGQKAVDRTINVLATALQAGMTVFDLEHLELAYAPPFGAAKDPVNIAGFVAANNLRGDTELVRWDELADFDPEQVGILDVRTEPEWQVGHLPNAVHIPNTELRQRLDELDRDKEWVLCCSVGRRAYVMERMMRQQGFKVRTLTGGLTTYRMATDPIEDEERIPDAVADEVEVGGNGHRDSVQDLPVRVAVASEAAPVVVDETIDARLDACGLQCPGPIMAVYKRMQEMPAGQTLEVLASDPGFKRDVAAWAERTGNMLLDVGQENGAIRALLRKGGLAPEIKISESGGLPNAKTLVVFSSDLDRALAAFVIANGAAAMGQQVTMFFTFWGLNILRRQDGGAQGKNAIEAMFGMMMPKGSRKLALSRLNMGGMGTAIMKRVMASKNIDSLEQMIAMAQENGVRLMACQMSMDMMGIKSEELMDGVEIGGVATYINETDKANASLFI